MLLLSGLSKSSREYINIDTQIRMLQGEIRNEVKNAIATEQLELNSLIARKESVSQKMLQLQRTANEISQKEKMPEWSEGLYGGYRSQDSGPACLQIDCGWTS